VRCRHHQLVPRDRRLTKDARISPEFNATLMSLCARRLRAFTFSVRDSSGP
jgi:hypothetical protein